MLAEIYLLKLEAAVRAAKEAATTGFDLAVCAGHLTGWQGVLTPPSIAPSPSAACSQGAPPWIQNNSGPPQGPATASVVGSPCGGPTARGEALVSGIRRRDFVILLGCGAAAAWPLAARAQQQGKIPRIGIIDDAPMWNAFREGLRDLGYLEGQNIAFEYRTADGVPERLAEAATDLARRPVDVIATYAIAASIAAKAATTTIPIVMIAVGDVLRTGLVQGLAHPGGNITGNTILGPEVQPKRLQLFKGAVPALSHVALLWNPDNASHRLTAEEVRAAAATLSMTFTVVPVRRAEELDGALAAMMLERPDGLMVTGDPLHQLHVGRIINFLANNRLPGLFQFRENVVAGGLMSYGASLSDLFRRAAGYVDKILRGTRPAHMPV